MRLVPPRTAFATMSELSLALSQLAQPSQALLEPTFHSQLIEGEAALREALSTLDQTRLAKEQAASARRTKGMLLIRCVRDFHQNLTRTIKREPDKAVWLEPFRLKQSLPESATLNAIWLEQARQIAAAAEAVAAKLADHPQALPLALPNSPSVEQVAARLQLAQAAHEAYRQACATLKEAEAAARQMSVQGQSLLVKLRKTLSGVFHGLPPERLRAEMVKFGMRYANKAQDTREPDAPTPSEPLTQTPERHQLTA